MKPDWEAYLGTKHQTSGSLSLFPRIEGILSSDTLNEMERDRFRWLLSVYPSDPERLFSIWSNRNFLLEERKTMGDVNLEQFYATSEGLGIYLLREEVRQISYLKSLRDCLALRVSPEEPVLFLGPTSGADLEAIHAAGGMPHLVSIIPNPKWEEIAEIRLWDCRIPFEDSSPSELLPDSYRYVVISSWVTEPDTYVRWASNVVGKYGFLLSPATNLLSIHEARKLSLRSVDTFQSDVGVFYKAGKDEDLCKMS
jgi:hypothetical protein